MKFEEAMFVCGIDKNGLERITVDIYDLIPQNNDFWV
jgi:hypothetical protein